MIYWSKSYKNYNNNYFKLFNVIYALLNAINLTVYLGGKENISLKERYA